MCHSALSFHLTPDPVLETRVAAATDSPPSSVEIPPGPSALAVSETGGPRLLPVDQPDPTEVPDAGVAYVVEPLLGARRPQLTLLAGTGAEAVRVNGLPAPSVALLEPGDQVQLGKGRVLHVSLFRRPFVGAAGEEHQDKKCPVCRIPAAAEDVVYVCSNCETALHLDSTPTSGKDPLECALVGPSCPICDWDIVLTEGFTHELEL